MRIEELGRSVVFLTRENQELREQNELLRQMVVSNVSVRTSKSSVMLVAAFAVAAERGTYS